MELDYQTLDAILNYLKLAQGYRGWASYRTYYRRVNNITTENIITDSSYAGWCNTLLNFGLVDYKYDGNDGHTYIINYKGLDLVNSEKSTRELHRELKKREKLEDKILESSITSSRLNIFQFIVTTILGCLTAFSIYFQFQSNNLAKQSLDLSEKVFQLELENKNTIDTIIVKMDSDTYKPIKK